MSAYTTSVKLFSVNARANLLDLTRNVGFEMQKRVVERTPFDTGRAKSSWNIVEGRDANLDTTPELRGSIKNPGPGMLTRQQAEAAATDQQNNILILTTPAITVSNNLPYIEPLENGHSQQAPSGMFAITVREFRNIVEEEAAKLKI